MLRGGKWCRFWAIYVFKAGLKKSNIQANFPRQITVNTTIQNCFSPSWLGADFVGAEFVKGRVC